MERSDADKLRRLYELYEQPMYRIAFAVLRDSALAEDAVHDSFVKIIGKLGKLSEPESPRTRAYIIKAVKNASIAIYRRNKRRASFEQPIDEETFQLPDRSAAFFAEKMYVPEEISFTDRRIVALRCEYGLPWREVAEKVGLKEPAVRKRFERIRKKLMKTEGEFYEKD